MPTITGTEGTDILSGGGEADTILGLGGNDQLTGNANDDIIEGGSGDDILTGGSGSDTLTGGTGTDVFRDTMAGLNGDRITDLLPGDRIQITDLAIENALIGITGSSITFNGNSLGVDNLGPGRLIVRAIEGGGVEIRLQGVAQNDFNGDGLSDILWRQTDGTLTNWLGQVSGSFVDNSANLFENVGVQWEVAGTGDFNGDGRSDVLWSNLGDVGAFTNWLGQENGSLVDNSANFFSYLAPEWHVAGTGDFNGDGRDDILWRNSGDVNLFTNWLSQSNGGFTDNSANFYAFLEAGWQVADTGDFNGDGRDDILWRNSGDVGLFTNWLGQADGGFVDNSANFYAFLEAGWQVADTGDFNGDGRDDILWRNSGDVSLFTNWLGQANGGFTDNSANFYAFLEAGWQVASTGDYNGDARDDILWRNSNGVFTDWLGQTNGGLVDNSSNLWVSPGAGWQVQPDIIV